MFLIEPMAGSASLRADLAPRRLSHGAGDLVRAAVMASQKVEPAAMPARRAAGQLDRARPAVRHRKAG
jgi:hypothetical protein